MLALLASGARTLQRDHYTPGHFTASAFVLCPEGTHLLMIHHAKLARWLQPGGHVELADKTLLDAARREAVEETGVRLNDTAVPEIFDVDIHRIPARPREPAHLHFDVRYRLSARERSLTQSDEVNGVRWVPLEGVARLNEELSIARPVARLLVRRG